MTSTVTMKNPGASPLIAKTLEYLQKAREESLYSAEHFVDELSSLFGKSFTTNIAKEIGYHFVPDNLIFSGDDININTAISKDIKDFVFKLDQVFSIQSIH